MKSRSPATKKKNSAKKRTNVPGQNPAQNDAPDHDVHHDESRKNQYDPQVGEALKWPRPRRVE